jgi:aldehyde:ferredoxin oxidoreductase
MLKDYYRAMGWDVASGWPLPEKLMSLGLGDIAVDMERWEVVTA